MALTGNALLLSPLLGNCPALPSTSSGLLLLLVLCVEVMVAVVESVAVLCTVVARYQISKDNQP